NGLSRARCNARSEASFTASLRLLRVSASWASCASRRISISRSITARAPRRERARNELTTVAKPEPTPGADVDPIAVPVEEALFIGVEVGLSSGMDRDTSSPGRVRRLDVLRKRGLRRKLLPDGEEALGNMGDH